MKFDHFKDKFGSWAELFRPFIEGEKMGEIYKKLRAERDAGKILTPDSENVFTVFKECHVDKVKVIWYLQDPYPSMVGSKKVASGIAMDCSNTGILQPSLKLFWNAIYKEVYEELDAKWTKNPSLLPLVKEGIMFINTDLTCRVGESASHKGYWLEFQKYFIQEILNHHSPLIFVLSGRTSQELEDYIDEDLHYIFTTEHPVAASYQKREWSTKQVFKAINELIERNHNTRIPWIPELEQVIDKCPFNI